MKALIIGCGNIGGLYDLKTIEYKTYAKSFDKLCIDYDVYDSDQSKANLISNTYSVNNIKELNEDTIKKYNIFVISSPTHTHFNYLKKLIKLSPKLLICEKPISTNYEELNILEDLYKKNNTKIFVNYQRRFQPKLIKLKSIIKKKLESKPIQNIVVTYQNGIHNNGSHALDFISFLLDMKYKNIKIVNFNKIYDISLSDPTISANIIWNNININLIGVTYAEFSLLNIDIYFKDEAISLTEGCNKIEFKTPGKYKFLHQNKNQEIKKCMSNSMLPVSTHIKDLFYNKSLKDNFIDSIKLSKYISKSFFIDD